MKIPTFFRLLLILPFYLNFGATIANADSGMLGVILDEYPKDIAKKYGFNSKVVYAKAVLAGSAAAKGGMEENDIIIKFGKSSIQSLPALQKLAAATSPGTKIDVTIKRSGGNKKLAIVMGSRKEFDEQSINSLRKKPAPDLAGIDITTDKAVSLSDFKGNPVIIKLWATWCPSCKAAIPYLNKMLKEYKSKKLIVLAVSTEEITVLKKFHKRKRIQYHSIKANEISINRSYWADAIPTFILVDSKGIVREIGLGLQGLQMVEQKLQRL